MMFEELKQGLEEAISFERGSGKARTKTYMILPIKEYTGKEIREIRMKAGMTQRVFAYYMGVSHKTVEAWEHGTTHPAGPAFRLLELLDSKEISSTEYVIAK